MEISEINILSDFEVGMKCLQNPSFISRFFSFSGVEKIPQVYSFWKWSALILAVFATFSSVLRRIKLIFIRFHTVKPSLNQNEDVFDFSDDDDDISLASSDDENDEFENSPTTSARGQRRVDEDFCVKGLRWRSSGGAWPEFSYGKNVVKLWDSLGLSLDFDEDLFNYDSKSVVSTWENRENQSSDFLDVPTMVLTAKGNGKGDGVILGGYDTRMRRRSPALYAEWSSATVKAAGAGGSTGGVGKLYVRDDVSGVITVGDVRNVRRPLESDGETWWDADAVIVEDEFEVYH